MTLVNGSIIYEILHKKEHEIEEKVMGDVISNMMQEGIPISQISRITGLDVDSVYQLTLRK